MRFAAQLNKKCFLIFITFTKYVIHNISPNIILKMKAIIIFFFLIFSVIAEAQQDNAPVIVEFMHDNDIVFRRDRYYSSGINLKLYAPFIKKSLLNKILLPSGKNEISYYSLGITHHMYTPEATLTPDIQYGDRPYANYLLLGNYKMSFDAERRIKKTSGIELGWIGPVTGGELIQNSLHENISIAIPSEGWHNQINNDICVQYSALIEKGILNVDWLEFIGFVGGKLGVPHTEANIGTYVRIGYFADYFKGMSVDVNANWQAWLYFSSSLYLVNYNASLQGGTYNQTSVYTINNINNCLMHAKFGGVVQYKKISIEYGMEVSSPEYQSAFWHRWGHLDVKYAF